MMIAQDQDHEMLARALAANAGVDWDRLGDYPGYMKALWREQADVIRMLMEAGAPQGRNVRPR